MDEQNRNVNKLAVTAGKRQIFTDLYPFKVRINFYPNLHFRENKARLQGNDFMCHNKGLHKQRCEDYIKPHLIFRIF